MKKLITLFVVASAFLFSLATWADTYTLDPSHSYVLFHINHFGFSNPSGKWFVNGTLALDEAHPQNSKVDVTIKIADMDTGIAELDKHLKSPLFFDADKYPTATFVSNKVTLTGKHSAKVQGMLTVHGVTKPVTLDVTLNRIGINPIDNIKTAGFTASTKIKRSDFGMTALLPGLGDEVKVNIEAEGKLAS